MATSPTGSEPMTAADRRAVVLEYFDIADGRKQADMLSLFADDAEVYFPKFGVGRGRDGLAGIGGGLMTMVQSIGHDTITFRFVEQGDQVVVEGTSSGTTADGVQWRGGSTPGGRFCSVFDVRDGKIQRMYVYLDPDYGNADADRYPWPVDSSRSY